METVGTPALWAGFIALVLGMLALDLGVFHRNAHAVSLKEATIWSAVWVGFAAVFAVVVLLLFGTQLALEFTTGYLIEKALAVDNIFVFVVIFATFGVAAVYQHRVLFWGIVGALIMRAAFILAGGAFLQRFHWAMYVFGGLLIALVTVEVTDVVFAVDSIPAIFAVTNDPFIVFTSNIFAILGMRSLYFLLAGVVTRFRYLTVGLALVLVFVGAKMTLADLYKVPVVMSLLVIAAILGAAVLASVVTPGRRTARRSEAA